MMSSSCHHDAVFVPYSYSRSSHVSSLHSSVPSVLLCLGVGVDVEYPRVEVSPILFRNMAQVARARAGMTNTTGQVLSLLKLLIGRRQSAGGVQDYFDIDWDLSDETCS